MKPKIKKLVKIVGLIVAAIFIVVVCGFLAMSQRMPIQQTAGVTFSKPYVEEFKLNPEVVLTAALDDLKVRRFRIPAYWSLLQPEENRWDWSWLDQELDQIAARQGSVVLAVGQKLPRWPECWIPKWTNGMSDSAREAASLQYLMQTVNRYKNNPTVTAWQLENEPGFPFGTCPKMRNSFFDDELKVVRALDDSRPVVTTDSGELSFWSLGGKVDALGVSVYRVVIAPLGIFRYSFVPPQFYLRKGQVMSLLWGIKNFYISEFQMEPWTKRASLLETPIDEQMQTFDLKQMKDNIKFAKNSGISTIDYWGVEWWYWMKMQNRQEFWETAKTIFQ
ncbi:MAG: beta-galactosidase [Patescibacteria group bacterium]|jgi:hypothetical protein